MALLRETPPADAVDHARRARAQRDIDQRATTALHHRLNQLENEHTIFQHRLTLIKRAIPWLPKHERDLAQARVTALTGPRIEPFRMLRIDLNGHDRQPTPATGRPGPSRDPAVQDRRRHVKQLRAKGLTPTQIARRLDATVDQVRHDIRIDNALCIAAA